MILWPRWDLGYNTNWKFFWAAEKDYPRDVAIMLYTNLKERKAMLPNESIFMWFPDDYWRSQ